MWWRRVIPLMVLLCCVKGVALAYGEPEIVSIVLTTAGCQATSGATAFASTDPYIYCVIGVKIYRHSPRTSYDVIVEWYAPNGTLYFREDFRLERPVVESPPFTVCSRLAVKNTRAACLGGNWRVSITVPYGDRKSVSFMLSAPANKPPRAEFSWRYVDSTTIFFDGTKSSDPDGIIVSYKWDFGDGYRGEGPTVSHKYVRDGDYRVALELTDNCGSTTRMEKLISILPPNRPPLPSFTCPSVVVVGELVTFDATASYDPDGRIVSYTWDFGDGTRITRDTAVATHAYQKVGTYTVTLTVTDDRGASASAPSRSVQVNPANSIPVAYFSWEPSQPNLNQTVTFDASGSYDPDGFIRAYLWDFDGDGRVDLSTAQAIVTYSYAACGDKRVILRVTDDRGASSSPETRTIHVNCSPTARFTWVQQVPAPGQEVQFDGRTSSDPEGQIVSYRWDFGDGSPMEFGPQVSHVYAACGRYTVRLTVTDEGGLTHELSQVVRVNCPPVAAFEWSPAVPAAGASVTFTAMRDRSLSYDPDGTIRSYTWDFGDRTPPVTIQAPTTAVAHTYAQCGNYTVILTVTDSDGVTAATTRELQINCPPLAVLEWGPKEPDRGEAVTFDASNSKDQDGIITSYTWDFGDGSPLVTTQPPDTMVLHQFMAYGTYTVRLIVRDNDGALGTTSTVIRVVDRIPPSSTATVPPSACDYGWYDRAVTIAISASDNDAIGNIQYRINAGPVRSVSGSRASVVIENEGVYTVEYWATDRSGNEEAPHNMVTVSVDRTPPMVTVQIPSVGAVFYLNQPVTPQVTVADGLSGVAEEVMDSSIDTTRVGKSAFTARAVDRACLATTVTRAYYVRYKTLLVSPIERELEWTAPPPQESLRGQPVPVSFRITRGVSLPIALIFYDFHNTPVKPLVLPMLQVVSVRGSGTAETYSPVAGLGGTIVYNEVASRYEMTVPTYSLSGGVYELWLFTDDGGIHRFRFEVL